MTQRLEGDERAAVARTVRHLSARLAGDAPERWDAEARSAGLLSPEAEVPGIWGPGMETFGPGPSLEILAGLARGQAEPAFLLHLAGLAALVRPRAEGLWVLGLEGAWAEGAERPAGAWRLVPLPPGVRGVLLPAEGGGWHALDAEAARASATSEGATLALRALPFYRVPPPAGPGRPGRHPPETLRPLHHLGLTAIALGVARRAVARAREHAGIRWQGGRLLKDQPVVQGLLGEATAGLETAAALLDRAARTSLGAPDLLLRALVARTVGLEQAARAASSALQCLGGYGYMEDEVTAPALREVEMLRILHGRPPTLTRVLGGLAGGHAS